jgi:protein-S-isoprenylcysteine O-methyltransferase Ste14
VESKGSPKIRILPPVYFLSAILLEGAIGALFPPVLPFPFWLRVLGAVLVFLGFGLVLGTAQLFQRFATTIRPGEPSTSLIIVGPYRFTRNPIYLGMAVVLTGLALLLGSALPLVVVPVFVLVLDALVIRLEEAMLISEFGDTYRSYIQRVRRWL